MSLAKIERLITLMNVLIASPRHVAASELRSRVPGYPDDDASFKRSFERDKVELRQMGVPLDVANVPGTDPPVLGYRILPAEYALRDPGLAPDELDALRLASALVGSADGLGQRALLKLGGGFESRAPRAELPADPNLVAVFTAVAERRAISFRYRDVDRDVHPYRLQFLRGRWYCNGFDHLRGEDRWYRLERVQGTITVGDRSDAFTRPVEAVAGLRIDPWVLGQSADPVEVTVWFDPAVAPMIRAELGDATIVREDDDGLVAALTVTNRDGFRSWVLSFLDRAEVLGPPEVRAEIVAWLTKVADHG